MKSNLGAQALPLVLVLSLTACNPGAGKAEQSNSAPTSAAAAAPGPAARDLIRFSRNGGDAISDIGAARIAIFNGDPGAAKTLIAEARDAVSKAAAEAPTFTVSTTTSIAGKKVGGAVESGRDNMVPVGGQVVVVDRLVPSGDKQAHIDKANAYFKNGQHKEALDELRLAAVDVMYTRQWMPIASTSSRLSQAADLVSKNKYYEANLVLKAISDSVTSDTVSLDAAPKKS